MKRALCLILLLLTFPGCAGGTSGTGLKPIGSSFRQMPEPEEDGTTITPWSHQRRPPAKPRCNPWREKCPENAR